MFNKHETIIPEGTPPTMTFAVPNEDVILYRGVYQVFQFGQTVEVNGTLRFTWFPLVKIVFEGQVITGLDTNLNHLEELDLAINNVVIGKGLLYYRNFTIDGSHYTLEGHCFHCTIGKPDVPVNEVRFVLPNMRDFFGSEIKDAQNGIPVDGRFFFEDGDFSVTIDKLSTFNESWQLLRAKGGFMILYSGTITKTNGTFLLKDLTDYNFCIANFLYLLSGQRTAPLFLTGIDKSEEVWNDYPCHNIQIYRRTSCWSDFQWFNDLSALWQPFRKLWSIEKDRDFLMTVLHWYVEANASSAYIEGSIILAQTALELIFNWFIVEQKKILTKPAAKKKSADEKIRMLLTEMKAPVDIPPASLELLQVKNIVGNIIDGPGVFVKIRNALVHGDEYKRVNFLMLVDFQAKFQALVLGRWYIELCLLYILGYQGNYFNTAFKVKEKVPWAV